MPREQQAASWNAFVQSQSFDPNDVEALVPPLSVADEPRLRSFDEPNRPVEVVQGTYSKTFDGKPIDHLADSFEPFVPPDFEPARQVIDELLVEEKAASDQHAENNDEQNNDEQFSLLVELLIESGYFDREDIIVAITKALKEESKAVKLMEVLGLGDPKSIMVASICSTAVRKSELTTGEAVQVLSDIKGGAEIHEAIEAVSLELAVTVSADLQAMFDNEVDESFYVGDVSRSVEIFDQDDFSYDPAPVSTRIVGVVKTNPPGNSGAHQSNSEPHKVSADVANQHPLTAKIEEVPTVAFGYGRERLKIAKRRDVEPTQESAPVAAREAASPVKEVKPARLPEPPRTVPEPRRESPAAFERESGRTAPPAGRREPAPAHDAVTDSRKERLAREVLAKSRKAQEAVAEARKAQEARKVYAAPDLGKEEKPPLVAEEVAANAASKHAGSDNAVLANAASAPAGSENTVSPNADSHHAGARHSASANAGSQQISLNTKDNQPIPPTAEDAVDSKKIRKRNSTTFNSLQAAFVQPPDSAATEELTLSTDEVLHDETLVGNAQPNAQSDAQMNDQSDTQANVEPQAALIGVDEESLSIPFLDTASTQFALSSDATPTQVAPDMVLAESEYKSYTSSKKSPSGAELEINQESAQIETHTSETESTGDDDVATTVVLEDVSHADDAEISKKVDPADKKTRVSKAKVRGGTKSAPAKKAKRRK